MTSRSRPKIEIAAHCACGAVSVSANGPVLAMFLCSCTDCQRATGTGHSAVAMMRAEHVAVAGEVRRFERDADSGAHFNRSFCPACGTPILGQSSRALKVVMVPIGLLGGGDDWFHPTQLIFARSHRAWDQIAADVVPHEAYRDPIGPA